MVHRNHTTAWRIIDGANERWNEPERVDHEGDAGLIVDGAILEETENLSAAIKDLSKAIEKQAAKPQGPGGLSLHIGTKTLVALVTAAAGGSVTAALALVR